jgi:hypothetical protein
MLACFPKLSQPIMFVVWSFAFFGFLLVSPVLSHPAIARSPVILSFARRFNFTGASNIVRKDQARAKAFRSQAATKIYGRAVVNELISNQVVAYIASVGVGSPPTACESAITAVSLW